MRHFALSLIAVPISVVIAVALWTGNGLALPGIGLAPSSATARAVHRDVEVAPAPARVEKVAEGRRRSGSDPVASRVVLRRPVAVEGRTIPLAQAEDARSWR